MFSPAWDSGPLISCTAPLWALGPLVLCTGTLSGFSDPLFCLSTLLWTREPSSQAQSLSGPVDPLVWLSPSQLLGLLPSFLGSYMPCWAPLDLGSWVTGSVRMP